MHECKSAKYEFLLPQFRIFAITNGVRVYNDLYIRSHFFLDIRNAHVCRSFFLHNFAIQLFIFIAFFKYFIIRAIFILLFCSKNFPCIWKRAYVIEHIKNRRYFTNERTC